MLGHGEQPFGRSAYVCPEAECIDAAGRKGKLARALRADLEDAELARVKEELACKLR